MAEIVFSTEYVKNAMLATWETVTCGDTGLQFPLGNFNDNTIQVTGDFNSETLTLQGSNDGSTWFTLVDANGLAIALTSANGSTVGPSPRYIRPSFSGASGGDVDVTLMLRVS